jgi:uncharacterized protein involved in high-affinity Fe2+ transport
MATIPEIRAMRSRLEASIGMLIREFEREAGVQVGTITFGAVYVQPVGELPRPQAVQPREAYECLVELVI